MKEVNEMYVLFSAYSPLFTQFEFFFNRQSILDRFVSDYAAIEDKIRSLWKQLLLAQSQSLVRLSLPFNAYMLIICARSHIGA